MNTIFEDTNIKIFSSTYLISDFDKIDQINDSESLYYQHKRNDVSLYWYYSKNNYYKTIENDTILLISLGTKIHEETGKKSVILKTDFENNILKQYYLNYFIRSKYLDKKTPRKEIEIRILNKEHFLKFSIEDNSYEYNLAYDVKWANEMIKSFQIELKN